MKKIYFALLIVSVALVGMSFACATDVDSHSSDLPIVHETQHVAHLETTHPDLWGFDSLLGWTHHERNPRGLGYYHHDDRHQRG